MTPAWGLLVVGVIVAWIGVAVLIGRGISEVPRHPFNATKPGSSYCWCGRYKSVHRA